MPSILIVEKLGNIKPLTVKSINEDELYKKAGFKVATDFKCHTVWNVEVNHTNYSIHLYGKTSGRANQENKYDFPPPMDNALFFGNCLLISKNKDTVLDLTPKIWDSIYDHLFGGFDDIGENDSDDVESEEDMDIPKTKSGYAKDGFIIDDDDDEDDNYEDDDDDEPELVIPVKKTRSKTSSKKVAPKIEIDVAVEEMDYLDCKSELSEESYIS
jgi:hypothetical protein